MSKSMKHFIASNSSQPWQYFWGIAVLLCVFLAVQGHVAAYSGGVDCTGTSAGNVNTVIYVKITDGNGNDRYADHFSFTVDPYNNGQGDNSDNTKWNKYNDHAILWRNNGTAEAWSPNGSPRSFTVNHKPVAVAGSSQSDFTWQQGNYCVPPGESTVKPAYAFRDGDKTSLDCWPNGTKTTTGCPVDSGANRPDSDNNGSAILSCLGSKATAYMFTLDKSSVPGLVPGGTWEKDTHDMNSNGAYELNNNDGKVIVFHYIEPVPSPPSITPEALIKDVAGVVYANGAEIEVTDQFTAYGQLTNSEEISGAVQSAIWETWFDGDGDEVPGTVGDSPIKATGSIDSSDSLPKGTTTLGSPYTSMASGSYAKICSRIRPNPLVGVSPTEVKSGTYQTCITVVRRPYFQVNGGDVNAAAVFPDAATGNCNTTVPTGKGIIAGWNKGPGGGYLGASTNIAAFAAQGITDFVSYKPGAPPKGLTFASAGALNGNFDQTYCIDKVRAYDANPHFIVPNTGPNTYKGNITTNSDIKISKDVTTIIGTFITKGNIYTCAIDDGANGRLPNNAELKSDCASTLTINGAFIANIVYLLRSNGSVNTGPAAEIFNYGPEVWLPSILPPSSGAQGSINLGPADSETTLSPVL